jgi:small subunit ribosomal protein S17e
VLPLGKVRTETIKRISRNLYSRYPNYFSPEFQENKEKLRPILVTTSKSVRNRIAGYVTRVIRVKMKESESGQKSIDSEEEPEESG